MQLQEVSAAAAIASPPLRQAAIDFTSVWYREKQTKCWPKNFERTDNKNTFKIGLYSNHNDF